MHRFIPQHINAHKEDLSGNDGLGRYLFITGSDSRACQVSEHFENKSIRKHERQHNLYLGTLRSEHDLIDVAAISSGMGGSSMDIIVNELLLLGVQRILRVGTAGSLQPKSIHIGELVIATAAIRDDKASWDYIYKEFPAIASIEYIIASLRAAKLCCPTIPVHHGIVHSKSSLFARELSASFLVENKEYMDTIKKAGALASEMECAQLFTLATLMTAQKPTVPILCGAILAIIGDKTPFSKDTAATKKATQDAISLSLETTRQLSLIDKGLVALV